MVNQHAPVPVNFKYGFDIPGAFNCLIEVLNLVVSNF